MVHRGGLKSGSQVWRIMFLLLLTTSASTCLKNSFNVRTISLPSPVQFLRGPSQSHRLRDHYHETRKEASLLVPHNMDDVVTVALRQHFFKHGSPLEEVARAFCASVTQPHRDTLAWLRSGSYLSPRRTSPKDNGQSKKARMDGGRSLCHSFVT